MKNFLLHWKKIYWILDFSELLMFSSILLSNIMIVTSSLFHHKMNDSLEVEKRLFTGLSDISFFLQQQGPRWNDHSHHTFQFLV